MCKRLLLLIMLVIITSQGGALATDRRDKKSGVAGLEQELHEMFDFLQWADKSGTLGVFHANLDVRQLFGPKWKLKHLSITKLDQKQGRNLLKQSLRGSISSSKGEQAAYACTIIENVSVRGAHRELCMQWLQAPSVDQPRPITDVQIGNYHFVRNPKKPTFIVFSRGNVVVTIGSMDDQPKSIIPVAKEVDRRLQMKRLTAGARLQGDTYYKAKGLGSARDIEPGEKIVVARNVRKEKKSLSVVSSSGTLYLNDKDQLILDTTGTKESKIRVWEVQRTTCRTGIEEKDGQKGETEPAQKGGIPTLDSGPRKNTRETREQDEEHEEEEQNSPPPVTNTLGDTE